MIKAKRPVPACQPCHLPGVQVSLSFSLSHKHTHTHTHTHTHAHTHTDHHRQTSACSLAHTHIHCQSITNSCTPALQYTCTCALGMGIRLNCLNRSSGGLNIALVFNLYLF